MSKETALNLAAIALGIIAISVPPFLEKLPQWSVVALFVFGGCLLIAAIVGLTAKRFGIKVRSPFFKETGKGEIWVKPEEHETPSDAELNRFFEKTYPRSTHSDFLSSVERLIPVTRNITLISSALTLIWDDQILNALMQRAESNEVRIAVCLGNPFSPHLQSRWVEEMQYEHPMFGKEALTSQIQGLLHRVAAVPEPKNISVSLFEHYPTLATLMFDDDIFVYPYGYQLFGTLSPLFHLRNDGGPEARFFIDNAQRILDNAIPAQEVLDARVMHRYESDNWISLAIAIVPESGSALYDFGSRILGYDIRSEKLIKSGTREIETLRSCVGQAKEFGFQASLTDHLFFVSENAINHIEAEVQALSEDFGPFKLAGFGITDSFCEGESLVVLCKDESGITEALHCELVNRIYRCAISSDYLVRSKHNKSMETPRTRLMMSRYGAPNILKAFNLYFSLCSNMPEDVDAKSKARAIADDLFHSVMQEGDYEVREICLVIKRPGHPNWQILKTFPLTGR